MQLQALERSARGVPAREGCGGERFVTLVQLQLLGLIQPGTTATAIQCVPGKECTSEGRAAESDFLHLGNTENILTIAMQNCKLSQVILGHGILGVLQATVVETRTILNTSVLSKSMKQDTRALCTHERGYSCQLPSSHSFNYHNLFSSELFPAS